MNDGLRLGCVEKNDNSETVGQAEHAVCNENPNGLYQAECVDYSVKRTDENYTKLEPVRKRIRVWTKLKNGLYAWRYKAMAKKHAL